MACTVAVEKVISEHYNDQIRMLLEKNYSDDELKAVLKKNRDDELEHLHTATHHGAELVSAAAVGSLPFQYLDCLPTGFLHVCPSDIGPGLQSVVCVH